MRYIYPIKPNRIDKDSEFFKELDNDEKWIAEVKKNGWRTEAYKYETGDLKLWTRNHTPLEISHFHEILMSVPKGTLIDGEGVFCRPKNWPKHYFIFDILFYKNKPLYNLPLSERRKYLEDLYHNYLTNSEIIELSKWQVKNKIQFFEDNSNDELNEGIVIKRLDSKYPISYNKTMVIPQWIKVRNLEEQFKEKEYVKR